MPKPTLHVIPGSPQRDSPAEKVRKRLRAAKPAEMLQCHRCGGREILTTTIGAVIRNGKVSGGTKQVLCAGCLMKGERIVLA